jgi:hypothetical protein
MADKPLWIVVDNGDTFEGTQEMWADCFFSDATKTQITSYLLNDMVDSTWSIREMTDEEIAEYPSAVNFAVWLKETYNEE